MMDFKQIDRFFFRQDGKPQVAEYLLLALLIGLVVYAFAQ